MLEILAAAEPLPVRVLDPALHHRLIGQVEGVLEIGQPDHQPRRLGGPAERTIEAAKLLIEAVPVDQTGQAKELVALIEDLIETAAVEIAGARHRRLGSHGKTPVLSGSASQEPAFYNASRRRRILQPQSVVGCSGPTTYRDEETAWAGHKRRKAIHGFKAHVAADADTVLVEELAATPSNVNDERAGGGVLPENPTFMPTAPTAERPLPLLCRAKAYARVSSKQESGDGLVVMPYASCGPGTITFSMCAPGSRKSSEPGSAATDSDGCVGRGWRKSP